jgi:hypothetical protein
VTKRELVPGGRTGSLCSWGIYIQGPGPPGWGSLESKTVKCGQDSDLRMTALAWPAAFLVNTDPSYHQRGCYTRTITASVQLKKIAGHESQGACHQDELIGSKLPVVKRP